ncbi:ABC transporter substrate-binding protein [Cohnella hashimotonis]|uniref:Extracellular solute-binding protein n=1 Tax=Cohnella hashimotonis TaxID=2826895 RepID=A0ABT6THQ8_9BACL|nr:extracellular solute-binding protein [Cohnella hashimotonis]MDI4646369.1 extracellular solute-binding protein [Cohnella hashimotonis]
MRSRGWLAALCVLLSAGAFIWAIWSYIARSEQRTVAGAAEPAVKLTWYHHFREEGARKWLEIGTRKYMEAHPNVTVEVISEDGNTYANTLHNLAAVERMPDIYMTDNIQMLQEFIDAGYAMDMTGNPALTGIDPTLLGGVEGKDGKVWAVPFDRNGVGVFYNRAAFAKAGVSDIPRTWDAFLAACRKLEQAGIQPIAAGYQDMWTLNLDIQPDMIASGIRAPTWIEDVEAGRASFADDKGNFKNVLRRLAERFPYTGDDPFGTNWNEALELLAGGEAAMILNGSWTVDGVRSFKPDADIGMFAFPSTNDASSSKVAMKTTGGFVVNPKSRHADEAISLVRYFSSAEMAAVMQDNKKGISIAPNAKLDFDPAYEELDREYIQTGRVLDYSAFYPEFVNVELVEAFRNELIGLLGDPRHDVDRCIAQLDAAFDRIRPRAGAKGE